MKRVVTLLLALVMVVGMLPITAFAAETVDETNGSSMTLEYNSQQCSVIVTDRTNGNNPVVSGDYLLKNSWGEVCAEVRVDVKDGYRIKNVYLSSEYKEEDLTEDFIMGVYGWKPMLYAYGDFCLSVETEAVPSDVPTVTDVQIYFNEDRYALIEPGRNLTVTEDSSTYVYVKCEFSDGKNYPDYAARGFMEYSIDGENWETTTFGGCFNYFPVKAVQYADKYDSSSTAYSNYDFRIRIDPDGKHCTGGSVYSEVYHVNGGVEETVIGHKLEAPKNLEWHKYYHDMETSAYTDYKGAISWVVGDPDYDQTFEITVYKDNEWQYSTQWTYRAGSGRVYWTDWDFSLTSIKWYGDGTYHYTVQALGDGKTTSNSDTVASEKWEFEMPDTKIDPPTDLHWDGTSAKWTEADNAAGFLIRVYYSPDNANANSLDGLTRKMAFVHYYDISGHTNTTVEGLDGCMTDEGYYYFTISSVSGDISKNWHSNTYLSPAYKFGNSDETKLDAPVAKITGVSSTGKPKVSWNAVEGAAKYKLYWSTDGENFKLLTTKTGTSQANNSAKVGTLYYYYVVAVDENGNESQKSNVVKRTCDLPQPKITSCTNVASSGKPKITWNKVEGATKYKVYRSTSKSSGYSLLYTTTGTTCTNTSAVVGTQYYYKVMALHSNSAANSAYSEVVTRTCDLAQPEITSTTNVASSGKPKITWNKVDGATKYKVYRSTSKDSGYSLTYTTSGTSYTNSSAEAGIQYYYKVMAIHSRSAANSAYSEVVTRTCDLAQPKITSCTNVASSGKPKITWNKVEGATKYKVYRSTSKSSGYSLLYTTTGTSCTNTSAVVGTQYYYKVIALHSKSAANSAYSDVVTRTCDLARPVAKVSLNSSGKPVVSWAKIEGATKYTVYIYDADGTLLKTATTTNLKQTHNSAESGTTYKYRVVAVHSNTAANSAKSAIVSIKTKTASSSAGDYVVNTNSGKFHYPTCGSAATISADNRMEFNGTREELIERGYVPCGNCDP